jgi:hypothetical protein
MATLGVSVVLEGDKLALGSREVCLGSKFMIDLRAVKMLPIMIEVEEEGARISTSSLSNF